MKERLWTRSFTLLLLSNLFLFLALEMLLPTLPLFAADKGATSAQVGMIVALFTFSAVFSRFFIDFATAAIGRKMLLVAGVVICLIGTLSYTAATTVALMLVLRIVHGIGFGFSTTLFGTYASDIIPARRRGEGMGFFGTGNSIAISLGPFVGIWLMEEHGFGALFVTGAAILLIALLFTLLVKGDGAESGKPGPTGSAKRTSDDREETGATKGAPRDGGREETRGTDKLLYRFVESKALVPSFFIMLIGFAFGGLIGFITLFGEEQGLGNIAFFFLLIAVSEFLIRFVSGRIFDTKGRFWVIFPSIALCFIGTALLYYTDTFAMLMVSAAFYGAGLGALFPALQAWVIDRVEPHRRGVATATFYNSFDIGLGAGALLLGVVAEATGYATMFLLSSSLYLICLAVYFGYERRVAGEKATGQVD